MWKLRKSLSFFAFLCKLLLVLQFCGVILNDSRLNQKLNLAEFFYLKLVYKSTGLYSTQLEFPTAIELAYYACVHCTNVIWISKYWNHPNFVSSGSLCILNSLFDVFPLYTKIKPPLLMIICEFKVRIYWPWLLSSV